MADKAPRAAAARSARMLSNLDWESDIVLNSRKSQALAWRLLAAAVAVIVLLAVAIALMLPLKQVLPSVVVVDKLTGEGAVVSTGQSFVTTSTLTDKHWVNSFLLSRERYVYRFIQYDYDTVRRLASDPVWANYRPLFDGDKALDKTYKDDIEVIPAVLSITLNGSGMATVRYELRTRDYRSTSPPVVTRRIATLKYSYEAKNLTLEKEAIANPLGFVVTAYQTDPELTAETAAKATP